MAVVSRGPQAAAGTCVPACCCRPALRILALSLAVIGVLCMSEPAAGAAVRTATSSTTAPAPPPAKAELLVDVTTGRALWGENQHQPLPPASLTKILTAMIAVDWLPPGTLIPVSARAANVYPDRVGMKAGQRWPLAVTLHALLIFSANDAAYALAERVGGSLTGFATIMRRAAAQIGMSDPAVLRDPAGLDGTEGVDGGNRISAWDLAVAARDLMANKVLAPIVGLKSYRFTAPDGIVHDLSSKNLAFLDSYPGAIGVKTGYTVPAGVCVVEEAVRSGRAMLAVVMNGTAPDQTAAMLLDKGFAIPVSAEGRDPRLPPEREPEPPRPPITKAPITQAPATQAPATQAPAAPLAVVAPATPAGTTGASRVVLGVVGAGTIAALAVGGLWYRGRTRRRPVGGHSRRR